MHDVLPSPAPPATPDQPKKPDQAFYLALFAILISVIGTGISLVQTDILREQQQIMQEEKAATVWPYIRLKRNYTATDTTFTIAVAYENRGIGPALLGVEHFIDGETEPNTFRLIQRVNAGHPDLEMIDLIANDLKRVVIRPDETLTAYRVTYRRAATPDIIAETTLLTTEFKTAATYCSIYGECWRITSDTGDYPVRCEDCGERLKI